MIDSEFCDEDEFNVMLTAPFERGREAAERVDLVLQLGTASTLRPRPVPKVTTWLAPPFTANVSVLPVPPATLSSRLVEV